MWFAWQVHSNLYRIDLDRRHDASLELFNDLTAWQTFQNCFCCRKYRRLSLSQSPGYQTKYFEISVVWDSQSVTSFTFFMYVELQLARKQSRTVELRNVTDSTLFIHSQIGCDQCLFCTPFPQIYLWYTLINLIQFLQYVGYVCCLHQITLVMFVVYIKLHHIYIYIKERR